MLWSFISTRGVLLSFLYFALLAVASPSYSYQADAKMTLAAPWSVGERIAMGSSSCGPFGHNELYRVFWGATQQGDYILQEFYLDGNKVSQHKFSDPYIMKKGSRAQVDRNHYCIMFAKTIWGNVEGPFTIWSYEGEKKAEHTFKKGFYDGVQRYYKAGKLLSTEYHVKGERQGASIQWYPNGEKAFELYYENDQPHGIETHWRHDGSKEMELTYERGEQIKAEAFMNEKRTSVLDVKMSLEELAIVVVPSPWYAGVNEEEGRRRLLIFKTAWDEEEPRNQENMRAEEEERYPQEGELLFRTSVFNSAHYKIGERAEEIYRLYLGRAENGNAVLQEFYRNGNKYSDPFEVYIPPVDMRMPEAGVMSYLKMSGGHNADGAYRTYYKNGKLRKSRDTKSRYEPS